MTDNELKIEVMKFALDIARESMYTKRGNLENEYERRTEDRTHYVLPSIDVGEVTSVYKTLLHCIVYK
jgi:hypothetical protein